MNKSDINNSFEAWELTAFLLGELDAEHATKIQFAIDSDPKLAAEVAELKHTIGVVRVALEQEDLAAASALTSNPTTNPVTISNDVETYPSASSRWRGRLWVTLLGAAAGLTVAVLYKPWSDYSTVDGTQLGKLSESEAAAIEEKKQLEKRLKSAKDDLANEVMTNRTSLESLVQSQGAASTDSSSATRDENASRFDSTLMLDVTPRIVVQEEDEGKLGTDSSKPTDDVGFGGEDYGTEIIGGEGSGGGSGGGMGGGMGRSIAGGMMGGGSGGGMGGMGRGMGGMGGSGGGSMAGSDGADDYSSDLLGDVQIEVVESVGMVIVKGTKRDVARTMEVIDAIKGEAPGASLSLSKNESKDSTNPSREQMDNESFARYKEHWGGQFKRFIENEFESVEKQPLSTFSIDVDTASYTKVRQLLMEAGQTPPAAAVRLEEFINYFDYDYAAPTGEDPFATHLTVANCPWQPEHQLVRVALQTTKPNLEERAPANVVFLIDVSGSMNAANKLPLVKDAMRMMIERLGEKDRVAMVVYAGAAGCVLEGTPGNQQTTILSALDRLQAGGSTNGGQGIQLAYQMARDQFIPGGNNRVVLCTDGDFNVGVTDTRQLVDMVAENAKSKVFLTVLGFGTDNTNDQMMEQISNRGNGVYAFVDSWREAKRQMVDQFASNLITVAKDVKIQVEFNPEFVKAYRLLGYENRMLATKDFNDDTKDAGEIGAGHRVTALYEVVPVGASTGAIAEVDDLLFQKKSDSKPESTDKPQDSEADEGKADAADADKLANAMMAVKLRYKQPEGDVSKKLVFPLSSQNNRFQDADRDFRWAASMAQFGMLLRQSRFAGNSTWSGLIEQAREAAGSNPDPQREEALQMIDRASRLR